MTVQIHEEYTEIDQTLNMDKSTPLMNTYIYTMQYIV